MTRSLQLIAMVVLSAWVAQAQSTRLAQIAFGGSWNTIFIVTNTASTPGTASLSFFGDDGKPLAVPFTGTGASSTSVPISLATRGSQYLETYGDPLPVTVPGYAVFSPSSADVSITAVVRQRVEKRPDFEAAIPPSPCTQAAHYFVPFDNTQGYITGFAIVNATGGSQPVQVIVTAREAAGTTVGAGFQTLNLGPGAHDSFALSDRLGGVVNEKRGVVEFNPQGGSICVVGLRFNPTGPFTTMPSIAGQ